MPVVLSRCIIILPSLSCLFYISDKWRMREKERMVICSTPGQSIVDNTLKSERDNQTTRVFEKRRKKVNQNQQAKRFSILKDFFPRYVSLSQFTHTHMCVRYPSFSSIFWVQLAYWLSPPNSLLPSHSSPNSPSSSSSSLQLSRWCVLIPHTRLNGSE